MKLIVTNDSSIEGDLTTVVIPVYEFVEFKNQPFILTGGFDELVIDAVPEIPAGYISNLTTIMRVKPRFKMSDLNLSIIRIITEIVPRDTAIIRYNWIKDKAAVIELIKGYVKEFEWTDVEED